MANLPTAPRGNIGNASKGFRQRMSQIGDGLRKHWKSNASCIIIGAVISVVIALVVWWFTSTFEYRSGYGAGLDAGRQDAISRFSDETVDIAIERNLRIDQALALRQANFEAELAEREAEFHERLRREEQEFRAGLDTLISERYAEALLAADQTGYERGEASGFQRGRSSGVQEAQLACEQQLEEIRRFGRFWRHYVDIIQRYVEERPTTETEMRSRARAIVDVALQGRRALAGLAAQLNTQIDELIRALENDDLARANEIIRTLSETLGAKGELWQSNYGTIVEFEQT